MKKLARMGLAVLIGLMLFLSVSPIGVMAEGEERYEYYISGDDAFNPIYDVIGRGQTFTPQATHTIKIVKLKAYRIGSPGMLDVEIFATTDGLPTGVALAVGEYNGNLIPTNTNGTWFDVTLDGGGVELTIDVVYAIGLSCDDGDASNMVRYGNDSTSASYSRGDLLTYYEGEWSSSAGHDGMFEEWGIVEITEAVAETLAATGIEFDTELQWWEVTLNGKVTDDGGEACDAHFYYREKSDGPDNWSWAGVAGTWVTDQTFDTTLYDIHPEVVYEFLAVVVNSAYEEVETEDEWLAKTETGAILEFEADPTPSEPIMITLMYPMDKDPDNNKVELYGQVGSDGGSLVDAWIEYRVMDTPPYVLVGATNFIPSPGFELPDWWGNWTLGGAGAVKGLSTLHVKQGTYALELERTGANVYIKQSLPEYERLKGEDISMGAWVWCSTANTARLAVYDGVSETFSSFHTGSSTFEYLVVEKTVDEGATEVRPIVHNQNVIGSIWVDEVALVRGSSLDGDYAYHGQLETADVFHAWAEGLTLDIIYEFKIGGENDEGIGAGGIGTFTLNEGVVIPTIRTDEVTHLQDTEVRLWGKTLDDGGLNCWSWFQYRRSGQSNWIDTPMVGLTVTDDEWSRYVVGLNVEQGYDYRACAENEAGTGYGAIRTFGTLEAIRIPSIKTGDAEFMDSATVKLWAEVVFDGGSPCDLWIQMRVLGEGQWYETVPVPGVTTGYEIFELVGDLRDNWWYEYRAVGTNDQGTGYGEIESFNLTDIEEGNGGTGGNPFTRFDDWLGQYGLNNEPGHWLIMILLMGISFAVFFKLSSVLRVVVPLCFFALFIAMGWISVWIVLLLAFGAGITLFMVLRKQVSGGG